jgi:hypothetical protein
MLTASSYNFRNLAPARILNAYGDAAQEGVAIRARMFTTCYLAKNFLGSNQLWQLLTLDDSSEAFYLAAL